jgi:site-specific DNA-methyltransferase (adenine-specific)
VENQISFNPICSFSDAALCFLFARNGLEYAVIYWSNRLSFGFARLSSPPGKGDLLSAAGPRGFCELGVDAEVPRLSGDETMGLATNKIYQTDCIEGLGQIESGSVDLAFADPPFNIGYEYDVYRDRRESDEYLEWSKKWMLGVRDALKADGAFWLAIGDEYAAELKVIAQRQLGFTCRSWVIWYYTFGVNCVRGFSRSHTHLFHFVKDPKQFTFNADDPAIRVPSARQLVYADTRANPKGRLPDNTWILRPQDLPSGFLPDQDTWYFPRVAGTFKEREGFHGCQMPEQLLGRIIRCCSKPQEIVLDPFGGSGTTFTVAKKLDRQWIGFELSKDYVERIKSRLREAHAGDSLDGAADPLTSAPPTSKEPKGRKPIALASSNRETALPTKQTSLLLASEKAVKGLVDAYKSTHKGFSVDHMLADKELNQSFFEACRKKGLAGTPVEWNRTLLRIRKAGNLPCVANRSRTYTLAQMDLFSFASEIALQQLSVDCQTTLDGILCDPELAARFDDLAALYSPDYSSFEYRWAALALRKRAKDAKILAEESYSKWLHRRLPACRSISEHHWKRHASPGVYMLNDQGGRWLYVGETINLERKIELIDQLTSWKNLQLANVAVIPDDGKPLGLQAILVRRVRPVLNSHLLLPVCEAAA